MTNPRLRQFGCCHPALLPQQVDDSFYAGELDQAPSKGAR